jgi:hypothetical protein
LNSSESSERAASGLPRTGKLRTTVAAASAATVLGGGIVVHDAVEPHGPRALDLTGVNVTPVSVERKVHLRTWHTTARPRTNVARLRTTAKVRNKAYAFRMVAHRSWSGTQYRCLDSLWTHESNWDHTAYNPGSGAYGIPQSLPGRKMSLVAWDWRFNPQTQIRWGLRYIKGRYGSPCGAWGHFRSHNWY